MNFRVMIRSALSLLLVGLVAAKPNILFIFVDDLGYADLSVHGSTDISTPNIDRIARSGVQFTSAYSLAGFCSPARAGVMTGRSPARYGHVFNPAHAHGDSTVGLPLDQTIIPQTLNHAGYRSSIVGKWHLGFSPKHHALNRGFRNFFGFLGGSFNYFRTSKRVERFDVTEYIFNRWLVPDSIRHLTVDFTDAAIDYISESARDDTPFFLYLSYNAPHGPLLNLPEDLDESIEDPLRRRMAGMVTRLDKEIGRVVQHLRTLGIFDNTLIVFSNDNGGVTNLKADNSPFAGSKGGWEEGGIRVPFFMSWPGQIAPNQVINQPISIMDLYPTFEAVAEVPNARRNPDLEGKNLMPYIAMVGREGERRTGRIHEYVIAGNFDSGMVRRGPWKLRVRLNSGTTSLYRVNVDTMETTDVKSSNRGIHDELHNAFMNWFAMNPTEPAFGTELRPDPLTLTMNPPAANPVRRGTPVRFSAEGSHSQNQFIWYRWEVFRPQWKHWADFQLLRARAAPLGTPARKQTSVTFTRAGDWTVRVNLHEMEQVKWVDYNITVV